MKTWKRLRGRKNILRQAQRTEAWEQYIITSLL